MPGGFNFAGEVCNPQAYGASNGDYQNGIGINIQPPATANTKGAWVQLSAGLSADCDLVSLRFSGQAGGATVYGLMFDIAIGAAGSEIVIAPNIFAPMAGGAYSALFASRVLIPLSIPAGTRVAARVQCDAASPGLGSTGLIMRTFAGGLMLDESFSGLDDIGTNVAATKGTVITPTDQAKGSYSQIIAATARDYAGFFAVAGGNSGAAGNSGLLVDIAIGPSGSEQIIFPDWHVNPLYYNWSDFITVAIPAGTRIAARAAENDGSTKSIDLAIYGLYK
jgi:hypothetical protein